MLTPSTIPTELHGPATAGSSVNTRHSFLNICCSRPHDNDFFQKTDPARSRVEPCRFRCRAAHPQGVTGDILGIVTDTGGAIVPGAEVAVTNTGTPATRALTTSSSGNFDFSLPLRNYEFPRNDALDARSVISTIGPKPEFCQNQFGGSVGGPVVGPVVKNKTFFFADVLRHAEPGHEHAGLWTGDRHSALLRSA